MKILLKAFFISAILAITATSAQASPAYITLGSGQVITVPSGGHLCKYHPLYCNKGFKPDGTFPFKKAGKLFLKAIDAKIDKAYDEGYEDGFTESCPDALDYPVCIDGELVLSPNIAVRPCYRLVE